MGPTPSVVGKSFVKQYYTVLNTNPDVLHRFYTDKSNLTHGENLPMPENDIPIIGQKEIHDKLMSHGFDGCRAELTFVDCQRTLEDGVVILMHGFLTNRGMKPRRFTQVIVLAVQENGYYVQNDILRFLDPSLKDNSMMDFKEESHESLEQDDTIPLSPPSHKMPKADLLVSDRPDTPEPTEATSKSTQLSIVASEGDATSTTVPVPVSAPSAVTPPPVTVPTNQPEQQQQQQPSPVSLQQKSQPRYTARAGTAMHERQVAPKSIFVGNLPVNDVDVDKLRQVFAEFGPIADVNVVFNKTFAFIDFETEEATAAVLAHSEFVFMDRRLNVHPKRLGPRPQRRGDYDHRRGRGHWHRRGNRGRGRGGPFRHHDHVPSGQPEQPGQSGQPPHQPSQQPEQEKAEHAS